MNIHDRAILRNKIQFVSTLNEPAAVPFIGRRAHG
jgi:hypothetical protein